jgi:hypothetical protein
MSTTDEQDRLLRGPRAALQRARRDQATWADLAYCDVQDTDEGAVTDRNRGARFAVLWALQYDRRPRTYRSSAFSSSSRPPTTARPSPGAWHPT